ncbi:MAG: 2-hydroxy-3-oxopropionate reductase [Parvibaculaceae bacterium]
MEIGFIGLGVMGAPMAAHIANAGHEIVTTLNTSPLPASLQGRGVRAVATPAEVAAACAIVITMLPDTPDVAQVVRGPRGLIEAVTGTSLIIDMSSISPIVTRELAAAVKDKGADYVDAPVSGGEVGAKAASLTIMAGGSRAAFERAKPYFELLGKNITLIGEENGAGQTCKIANQIIVAITIEAIGEALVLASKAGCDPARVREALMGGFATSRVLEVHGERMIKRTFAPGFAIRLHQKDLAIALSTARSLGLSLPGTALCQELFSASTAQGHGNSDHSALIRSLESLADHEIAR